MQTAGSVLKSARVKKRLSLAEVEKATKIKVRILEKIESDEFEAIGSFGHLSGLVKNYGEFLGLNIEFLLALLRRQANFSKIQEKPSATPQKFLQATKIPVITILVLFGIFGYFTFQLLSFQKGPELVIFTPQQGAIFNLPKIQVAGKTESEAQIIVNNQKIPTSQTGEFSTEFELQPGINTIEIVAKGKLGIERRVTRTVEFSD